MRSPVSTTSEEREDPPPHSGHHSHMPSASCPRSSGPPTSQHLHRRRGEHHTGDNRGALLAQADAVLIVYADTLPDINSRFTMSPSLMKLLESAGHQDYAHLVLTKSPHKSPFGPAHIGAGEIKSLTGLSTLETMPWEPAAAAHYSHGAPAPTKKSPWLRKLNDLVTEIDQTLESRRYTPPRGEE